MKGVLGLVIFVSLTLLFLVLGGWIVQGTARAFVVGGHPTDFYGSRAQAGWGGVQELIVGSMFFALGLAGSLAIVLAVNEAVQSRRG